VEDMLDKLSDPRFQKIAVMGLGVEKMYS